MLYSYQKACHRLCAVTLFIGCLLGSTLPAHAEAGKGLSRITTGEILWGIFLFAVGAPLLLGLFVFALLSILPIGHKGSLGRCLSFPVITWVVCLGLLVLDGEYRHVESELLMSAFVAVAAAVAGYYAGGSGRPATEHQEQEELLAD